MAIDGRYIIVIAFVVLLALASTSFFYYKLYMSGAAARAPEVTATSFESVTGTECVPDEEMLMAEAEAATTSNKTSDSTVELPQATKKHETIIAESCSLF